MARRSPSPPRELAARALCRFHGVPEDTQFEGKPMWMSYLPEVDVVLRAAQQVAKARPRHAGRRMTHGIHDRTFI